MHLVSIHEMVNKFQPSFVGRKMSHHMTSPEYSDQSDTFNLSRFVSAQSDGEPTMREALPCTAPKPI